MKYKTHDSIEFYIPDIWLAEFGLTEMTLVGDHFVSDDAEKVLDIWLVNSPVRGPGVRWFHYESMRRILPRFISYQSLSPIKVDVPPPGSPSQGPLDYRVRNGLHRYYASVAVGFRKIPVRILPYYDILTHSF